MSVSVLGMRRYSVSILQSLFPISDFDYCSGFLELFFLFRFLSFYQPARCFISLQFVIREFRPSVWHASWVGVYFPRPQSWVTFTICHFELSRLAEMLSRFVSELIYFYNLPFWVESRLAEMLSRFVSELSYFVRSLGIDSCPCPCYALPSAIPSLVQAGRRERKQRKRWWNVEWNVKNKEQRDFLQSKCMWCDKYVGVGMHTCTYNILYSTYIST
jgi:hypothetical protein